MKFTKQVGVCGAEAEECQGQEVAGRVGYRGISKEVSTLGVFATVRGRIYKTERVRARINFIMGCIWKY